MPSYSKDTYLVLDGVLILYTGAPADKIVIPSTINNQIITRIGSGAFRDCWKLKSITIPDTVTNIEDFAFNGCGGLEEIIAPVFKDELHIGKSAFSGCASISRILTTVSEEKYRDIYSSGQKLEDETVLILNHINTKLLLEGMSAYLEKVPIDTKYIFHMKSNDQKVLENKLSVYGYEGLESMGEDKAFINHINKGITSEVSSEEETMMDWYARADKKAEYKSTTLAYYRSDEIVRQNGKVGIKLYVSDGFHFVQSAVSVVYKGEVYYVYRRHYLTPDNKEPLMRLDMAVYTKNGLVDSKEVAEEIYAKYRLLSIL